MPEFFDSWFTREILAHEAALTRYLTRVWPSVADVPDIRHDTYVKVLEAAAQTRPHAPKSFMFSIARRLMADRARCTRIVAIDLMEDLDALREAHRQGHSFVDRHDPVRRRRAGAQRGSTAFG